MRPGIRNSFLGIIIVFAAGTCVTAQVAAPPPPDAAKIPLSKIPRVHRAPQLEDSLENHPREAELTVTDFRQNTPGDGTPATESTTAYLSYDDKTFYAVFVCHDEAGEVRAHLSKREASDQDDGVGILLDTFRDFHRAYFFGPPKQFHEPAFFHQIEFLPAVLIRTGPCLVSPQGYRIKFSFFSLRKQLARRVMSHRLAAKITGVAGYVPPKVMTNADLEKIVETNDEWIVTRTGIRERHVVEKGTATSHMATEAARVVLAQTKTNPTEIDLIVLASVTPDMFFPATACLVQERIGAKKAWGFDLSAACSGFAYALTVGAQFVGAGTHKKVLAIGSDTMTSVLDYKDRATCVLFGDGAGAALLEAAGSNEGILDFEHDVDGSGGAFLYMPGGGSLHPSSQETVEKRLHYVHQEGSQVFKYAVRRMTEMATHLLERNSFTKDDLQLLVPHQANLRIIRATQERLGVDDSKVMVNIDRYGNTTAGTIPLGLRDAVEQGRLHKGDLVLIVTVGAGYTTGGVLLRWAY